MLLLVGDIGGTRARFQLVRAGTAEPLQQVNWPSSRFPSLAEAVRAGLSLIPDGQRPALHAVWLAVAAPVVDGHIRFTNLDWQDDTDHLRMTLGLPALHVVNDLEAFAFGVSALPPADTITLQAGQANTGMRLAVAVGTGLGVAGWRQRDGAVETFASEAGHADLAPVTDSHDDLLHFLRHRHGHVSYERVLSGPGLVHLYEFACARSGSQPFAGSSGAARGPEAVTRLAGACDPPARHALELFAQLLGAFAGNCALQWWATGGIHLGGGVVSRAHRHIPRAVLLDAFTAKGRLRDRLARIPVTLITALDAGLEGVRTLALRQIGPPA